MSNPHTDRIAVHAATRDRWDDIVRVFESGAIANRCWCQWIRKTQRQAREDGPEGNRQSLRALVDEGGVPGMIAYVRGVPVGWCSVGPKSSFGRLRRSRALTPADGHPSPENTWATLCFYVVPGYRSHGVSRALLRAAVRFADRSGAAAFEVYPVRTEGNRISNDSAYPGTEQMCRGEGFEEVPSAAPGGSSQMIVRRLFPGFDAT
jgi:GNAT superfamily N-acetyltransferase